MSEDHARHAAKMAKKKVARDKIMSTKTGEKGLIMVHTGKGKGKSSAAFGMIFRCIAHDMKCAVVQFISNVELFAQQFTAEKTVKDRIPDTDGSQSSSRVRTNRAFFSPGKV
ncbi:MAG: cob(I)yrinic acid a,c-diamide adenosyltransferase, partial [Pacificibacter sp.]